MGRRLSKLEDLDRIDFEKGDGLVPVIVQESRTGDVLMMANANREAVERTLSTGEMWYFSRSRGELWNKGETSGNRQKLVSIHGDCDWDCLLARVIPSGPSCHRGTESCFEAPPPLAALTRILYKRRRALDPSSSYTSRLLSDQNLRIKKMGEETAEFVAACVGGDREDVRKEGSDVIYHALVACLAEGVGPERVLEELESRRDGA